ncbi:ABC transporter permease [Cytobacillus sp. FSL W7-1323]|uniref:ABC transporter permease n=1 Tax=Cytobacillus sp. FSL W7-1323 TaxID=2921700 RepID=UPI0031584900
MLKVNNRKVIHTLSKRLLKENKSRNKVALLAIILTSFMLSALILFGMNAYRFNEVNWIQSAGTAADAYLTNPTELQLSTLDKSSSVERIGQITQVASSEMDDDRIELSYLSKEAFQMKQDALYPIKGEYPKKQNEIMLSVEAVNHLTGSTPKKGLKIELPISDEHGNQVMQEFILTGWFTDPLASNNPLTSIGFVSKAYLESTNHTIENNGYADVQFKRGITAEDEIERLEQQIKTLDSQAFATYFNLSGSSDQMLMLVGIGVVILLIMFSGYLLIYNIFYLSISHDIRSYGLLKTIGTTAKQLQQIIRGQALSLSVIGIPIGSAIAIALAFGFALYGGLPNFFRYWQVQLVLIILSSFFAFMTVLISVWKPARKVGKISPVEATRYTDIKIQNKKTKLTTHGGKIGKMAWRNIFRHGKRTTVVFMSLFFGLTTFLSVFTVVESLDIENYVSRTMVSDIEMRNSYMVGDDGEFEPIYNLSSKLINEVKAVPGVTAVMPQYESKYKAEFSDEFSSYYNWAKDSISKADLAKRFEGEMISLESEDFECLFSIQTSEINSNIDLPKSNTVYLSQSLEGTYELPSHFDITHPISGKEYKVNFGGYLPISLRSSGINHWAPTLIVPEKFMNTFNGKVQPVIGSVYVSVEKGKDKEVHQQIQQISEKYGDFQIETKEALRDNLQLSKIAISLIGGGFSVLLALIGIVNFINIMFTGIINRKQELSVLESIGMTRKQVNKMVAIEGAYYAMISLGLVWTLGNGIAYGLFTLFNSVSKYAVYQFPVTPMVLVSLVVVIICVTVPLLTYKKMTKQSITERLQENMY